VTVSDMIEERTYSIGALARELGLTPRSIRFYEDEGLIAPSRDGTARIYSHADRARLILICRGKRLGFSLAEIADFLTLYEADPDQAEQMRYLGERCRQRIAALQVQLHDVQQTLLELHDIDRQIGDHLAKATDMRPPKADRSETP
jgi:DNA-binding transcriptional MerR regulator